MCEAFFTEERITSRSRKDGELVNSQVSFAWFMLGTWPREVSSFCILLAASPSPNQERSVDSTFAISTLQKTFRTQVGVG